MTRIRPSEAKVQALHELTAGAAGERSGPELLSELVRRATELTVQELLEREQDHALGRGHYQRGAGALYRNGYEPGTLRTAEGVLHVEKPQVRGAAQPYRSALWSRLGSKSQVLEAMVTEMYVRGLSVRDVEAALLEATGAFVLSDTAVSQVTRRLGEHYEAFRERDLSTCEVVYLFLDAVYEPLRRWGSKLAVLCAWGICADGSRALLGLTTGSGESTGEALELLRDLVRRGLRAPLTITTDGAPGLIAATEQVFPRSWRIRCWFHKMQNLQSKVPPAAWPEFKAMVCEIRDASGPEQARQRAQALVRDYEREFPEACRCLTDDLDASLNHLHVLPRHRPMVRTTNLIERTFEEQRRRTKVIPHLLDEPSALRLLFAVLAQVSDRWNRRQFSEHEERQLLAMRAALLDEPIQPKPKVSATTKRRSAAHAVA